MKPVNQCIFHNRLKGQFGHIAPQKGLFVLQKFQLEPIPIQKAVILDQHITADIVDFICQRHHVFPAADAVTEKISQCLQHIGHTGIAIHQCLTPDTLNIFVKEMRVDLALQGLQRCLSLVFFGGIALFGHVHLSSPPTSHSCG